MLIFKEIIYFTREPHKITMRATRSPRVTDPCCTLINSKLKFDRYVDKPVRTEKPTRPRRRCFDC